MKRTWSASQLLTVTPLLSIIGVRLFRDFSAMGPQLFLQNAPAPIAREALFFIGWLLGFALADLNRYAIRFFPKNSSLTDLWSQWHETVRSVVTIVVLAILGLWLTSSSSSQLGWGAILGLQFRLLAELISSRDYSSWYRLIDRPISRREHQGLVLIWAAVLLIQIVFIFRG